MRQSKPYYRKQRGIWSVRIGGRQVSLGTDKAEAFKKFYALMTDRQPVTDTATVVSVLKRFLDWNKEHRGRGTHKLYAGYILSFGQHVGNLKINQLKPHHVTEWVDLHYGKQSANARRNAIRSIQRALNWAVDEGHLAASPIKKVKKPAPRSRDKVVEATQWATIAAAIGDGEFTDFVTFLKLTGCRPQEARAVEARHIDRKNRCVVFERSESKGDHDEKAAERRVVPLSDEVFALCVKLAMRYPEGPIFRNEEGRPWTTRAVGKRFERLSRKLKLDCSAYTLRHTFATNALENGVDPITVATLMGHKDLTQLMKTYQHLQKKADHLRRAMAIATAAPPTPASLAS